VEVLLNRYSPTPYHHATPKVGHLLSVKCPHHLICPMSNAPYQSLAPIVKAHTKLPMVAAYPYLTAGYGNGERCE